MMKTSIVLLLGTGVIGVSAVIAPKQPTLTTTILSADHGFSAHGPHKGTGSMDAHHHSIPSAATATAVKTNDPLYNDPKHPYITGTDHPHPTRTGFDGKPLTATSESDNVLEARKGITRFVNCNNDAKWQNYDLELESDVWRGVATYQRLSACCPDGTASLHGSAHSLKLSCLGKPHDKFAEVLGEPVKIEPAACINKATPCADHENVCCSPGMFTSASRFHVTYVPLPKASLSPPSKEANQLEKRKGLDYIDCDRNADVKTVDLCHPNRGGDLITVSACCAKEGGADHILQYLTYGIDGPLLCWNHGGAYEEDFTFDTETKHFARKNGAVPCKSVIGMNWT